MPEAPPKISTITDLSKRLDVPENTIYRWAKSDLLPAERVGSRGWLFLREQVETISYVLHEYGRHGILDGIAARKHGADA